MPYKSLSSGINIILLLNHSKFHLQKPKLAVIEWFITGFTFDKTLERRFYDAYLGLTDYGACCVMVPYLDFVNNATRDRDPADKSGEDFHSIPYGARYL